MKKKMMVGVISAMFAMTMSMSALAGNWQSDANGWWYQNDDGSYPANSWSWIDGNGDGIAESYYFNEQGYCLMNATTPDGNAVNQAGAWTVNGVVQTKNVAQTGSNETANAEAVSLLDLKPVSGALNRFTNLRTNKNELWSSGMKVLFSEYSVASNSYAEFYVGGQYSTLTATIAVPYDFGSHASGCLEVYGDDDSLIYSSEDLDYKSDAISITVDISGQDYIKLIGYGSGNGHTYHGSNFFPIMIKNPQLR